MQNIIVAVVILSLTALILIRHFSKSSKGSCSSCSGSSSAACGGEKGCCCSNENMPRKD